MLFTLTGTVMKGKNRGKAMGFPTANFLAPRSTPQGIFVSQTEIDEVIFQSITFIGTVDTFEEKDYVAETYILDFDKDIYSQSIKVNFLKKLRDNQKFESVEELIRQMEEDKKKAVEYFRKISH